jgi:hypothetical protein
MIVHDARTGEPIVRLRATHQQVELANARQTERVLAAAGIATSGSASRGQRVMAAAAAVRDGVSRVARRAQRPQQPQRPGRVDAPYGARPVAEDLPGDLSHEAQEEILATAVADGKFPQGRVEHYRGLLREDPWGMAQAISDMAAVAPLEPQPGTPEFVQAVAAGRMVPATARPVTAEAYPAQWLPDVAQDAMVNPVALDTEVTASAPTRNGEPQGYTSIRETAEEKAYMGQPDELRLQEGPIMFEDPSMAGRNAAGVARDAQLAQQRGRRGR